MDGYTRQTLGGLCSGIFVAVLRRHQLANLNLVQRSSRICSTVINVHGQDLSIRNATDNNANVFLFCFVFTQLGLHDFG